MSPVADASAASECFRFLFLWWWRLPSSLWRLFCLCFFFSFLCFLWCEDLECITGWHTVSNWKQAFINIRLRPGIATPFMAVAARVSLHLLVSRPLRPNVTSSIKPEVHNVVQRRRRRTNPQQQEICTQNCVPIGPEICARTDRQKHTDRQTHRRTGWSQYWEYSTPLLRQCKKVLFCTDITNTKDNVALSTKHRKLRNSEPHSQKLILIFYITFQSDSVQTKNLTPQKQSSMCKTRDDTGGK